MSDSSDYENELPVATQEKAKSSCNEESLPQKSKEKYKVAYNKFVIWQEEQGTKSFDEAVLVAYFQDLGQVYKSSTLWANYSMLRAMIIRKHNIDINNNKILLSFLKQKHVGYQAKKSKTLSYDEVDRFLRQASDHEYLDMKVALIIGIYGACKGGELCNLTVDDVLDLGSTFHIRIRDTKTHLPRLFMIESKYYKIIKEYIKCRPDPAASKRFFLNYRKGHCTNQVIGKNKIGTMPQKIAKFLGLKEPESYTGHSFRRSSATMLADAGAEMMSVKRPWGWKSDQETNRGDLDESVNNISKRLGQLEKLISSSVSQNYNIDLRNQSSIRPEVNNTDHGTSIPETSTPSQSQQNMPSKRIGNQVDVVTQSSSKRLRPSSREETLMTKVDLLQRRLNRRDTKIQLLEETIKGLKTTSTDSEETEAEATVMNSKGKETPLKIEAEIKIEPDTVSYGQSEEIICDERLPAESDVQEEFYAMTESIKFEEIDMNGEIETFNLNPTISSEKHGNSRSKLSSKSLGIATTDVTAFPSLCRLCATRSNDVMLDIFSQNEVQKNVFEKIEYCLPITVTETDNLTKQVCRLCLDKLEFCYKFHKSVVEAEKELITQGKQVSDKISKILPSSSHREHDYTMNLDEEEESNESFSWEAIDTHSTIIAEEVEIADAILENDVILPDPQPCSVEPFPTKIHCINKSNKSSVTKSNKNKNTNSTMGELSTSGSTSASGIELGDRVYAPVRRVYLGKQSRVQEKLSNSELSSSPITSCSESVTVSSKKEDSNDTGDIDFRPSKEVSFDPTSAGHNDDWGTIKCRFCDETFKTVDACYSHTIVHASKRYYPCCFCNEVASTKRDWLKHKMVHRKGFKFESTIDGGTYNCNQCGEIFDLPSALTFHKMHHKVITKLGGYCKICDKFVDLEKSLHHHMLTVHREHFESFDLLKEGQLLDDAIQESKEPDDLQKGLVTLSDISNATESLPQNNF